MFFTKALKTSFAAMIVAAAGLAAAPAEALPTLYNLSNTSVVNCKSGGTGAPHGLWTGNSGDCGGYFSITEGTLLIEEVPGDKEGTLKAIARNASTAVTPLVADIMIDLSDWSDTWTSHKGDGDGTTADYFGTATGMVFFYDPADTDFSSALDGYNIVGLAGGFAFQYGKPANDKDDSLGASGWFLTERKSGFTGDSVVPRYGTSRGKHWDVNASMEVPEPATLALIGAGLVGLGMMTRRRRSA